MTRLLSLALALVFISGIAFSQVTVKIPATTVVVVKTQNSLASDKLKERQEVVILMTAHLMNQPKAVDVAARLEPRYAGPLDAIRRTAQGGPKWGTGE